MTTIATAVLAKALIAPLTAIGALGHVEHAGTGLMASAGFIATPAQRESEQA